jgi:hypothetical protein
MSIQNSASRLHIVPKKKLFYQISFSVSGHPSSSIIYRLDISFKDGAEFSIEIAG